jgi:cation transport ATPase
MTFLFYPLMMLWGILPHQGDSIIRKDLHLATIKTSAVCDMCKRTIERAMAYEKGVEKSELAVSKGMLSVWYNPEKTDLVRIKKAVSMVGYDADEVPANTRAYQKLHECCKKDKGIH